MTRTRAPPEPPATVQSQDPDASARHPGPVPLVTQVSEQVNMQTCNLNLAISLVVSLQQGNF